MKSSASPKGIGLRERQRITQKLSGKLLTMTAIRSTARKVVAGDSVFVWELTGQQTCKRRRADRHHIPAGIEQTLVRHFIEMRSLRDAVVHEAVVRIPLVIGNDQDHVRFYRLRCIKVWRKKNSKQKE